MRYVLLAYGPPDGLDSLTDEERAAWQADDVAFNDLVAEQGVVVAGFGLGDVGTATTVRVQDGEAVVTDGPFAETAEVLGGFLVIDVPDLDTAIELTRRSPAARTGTIEVRPVVR